MFNKTWKKIVTKKIILKINFQKLKKKNQKKKIKLKKKLKIIRTRHFLTKLNFNWHLYDYWSLIHSFFYCCNVRNHKAIIKFPLLHFFTCNVCAHLQNALAAVYVFIHFMALHVWRYVLVSGALESLACVVIKLYLLSSCIN